MAPARTNYHPHEIPEGLVVEITSCIVSMTEISRPVTLDDLNHAREHALAALDLAKRIIRDHRHVFPKPPPSYRHEHPASWEEKVE